MNFFKGQSSTNDTHCCLFNYSSRDSQEKSNRASQDGLMGVQADNNMRLKLDMKKLNNVSSKFNKSQNLQQKEKVSLSKISARKANNSRVHYQKKQQNIHAAESNHSEPKLKTIQLNYNKQTLANYSFGQMKNQYSNSYVIKNPNNYQNSEPIRQIKGYQHNVYAGKFVNVVNNQVQTPRVGSNQPVLIKKQIIQPQKLVINNLVMPQEPIQKSSIRNLSRYTTKPQSYAPQSTLINSGNFKSQVNSRLEQSMKCGPVKNSFVQTQKNVVKSQVKQNSQKPIQKLRLSLNKKSSQNYVIRESLVAESRFSQNIGPQLFRPDLKTVQSVYGSQVGNKKQIQQSVILIDYFNPSQNLRQEIQNKIQARYNSQFAL